MTRACTPGFDDEGMLGELRVQRTRKILAQTDIAVLVVDGSRGMCGCDRELLGLFQEKKIPYVIVWNKSDLAASLSTEAVKSSGPAFVRASALTGEGITEIKETIGEIYRAWKAQQGREPRLVSDLHTAGDQVILVIPIDKAAPKGRLILPQQQVIRDILDAGCTSICTQTEGVTATLESLRRPPAIVITDSQAFARVQKDVPESIPLTSFSILMARYKGFLKTAVEGAAQIEHLKDGDRVLISEGCTHHRQCDDIGTVKIPRWLHTKTGKDITIETSSGTGFPEDLTPYALVIHCGGCMLNEREMQSRIGRAVRQNVPVTNYGTAIAYMNGILKRSVAMFPDLAALL